MERKQMKSTILIVPLLVILLIGVLPLAAYCQDEEETPPPEETPAPTDEATPGPSTEPTPTPTPTASASPTPAASATPTPEPSAEPEQTDEPTPGRTRRPSPTAKSGDAGNSLFIVEVGLAVVLLGGGGVFAFFFMKKRKMSEKSLRRMPSSQYQAWVLKKLAGKSPSSMDISHGIDGFNSMGHPLAIKQSEGVGMHDIDLFAASLAQKKAKNGVMVAFSFGDDAIRGRVRARRNYGLDIQTLTVRELIESRRPLY